MSILDIIFGHPAIRKLPPQGKKEVDKLLDQLIKIGNMDDYLSLQPGGPFNARCHHTGARRIGKRLYEIGGMELMEAARWHVKRKLKETIAEHLDYCWQDIGEWQP
jgi:predicted NUDIX family NTP pyrophosphohydrolase